MICTDFTVITMSKPQKEEKIIKRGFGIVELLIAMVILAVLSSFYFLSFSGVLDNVQSKADKANLRTLNSATNIYKELYPQQDFDVFYGIYSNNARLQMLVSKNCLSSTADPQQPNTNFIWSIPKQLWVLDLSGIGPPLSPLGNSFEVISSEMIDLITKFHIDHSGYPRTWNPYRYTDLGLDPSDWGSPINHITYSPSGAELRVRPEDGYSFFYELKSGGVIELTGHSNWNLIYNNKDKKWYHRSIAPENVVKIETLILA